MRRFFVAFYKELLLLIRDPAGLAILFVLPGVMVFLVSLIQDSALSEQKESKIPILISDLDRDTLGKQLYRGFISSGYFEPIYEVDNDSLDSKSVYSLTADGSYKMGIIIPAGVSNQIRQNASGILEQVLGDDSSTVKHENITENIQLVFDPSVPESYKSSVEIALERNINAIQTGILIDGFTSKLSQFIPSAAQIEIDPTKTSVTFETKYSTQNESLVKPNTVQHNVPAWTIFAMFFIVIPLGTNLVREKDNGIERRLRIIPGSFDVNIFGKISAFMLVAMFQFAFMLSTGVWWLPMLGLPTLVIGANVFSLILTAMVCAFAATAYGVCIGTFARTHEQAASFGSISVLIMAAMGGIWVPSFVMPPIIRTLGSLSPLHWALQSFYDVFLREADLLVLWPNLLKLIVFGVVLLGVSKVYLALKFK